MRLFLDILLLAALGIPIFLGWKRGFAESVLRFGRLILAVLATMMGGNSFSGLLDRAWIYPAVYRRVNGVFTDWAMAAEGQADVLIQKIPAFFRPFLDITEAEAARDLHELTEAWSDAVSHGISKVISLVVGHILLFVLSFLLLTVALRVLRGITRLPVIRTADHLLGLALGAGVGLLLAVFLSGILENIMDIWGQENAAEQSFLLRLLVSISPRIT
jgi:uncharacterized membrane protein required for colicin V production